MGSAGPGSGMSRSGWRAASRASFSICFGEGIRQLAGRSFVMDGLEQKQNKKSSR
jgi:hypothetical protein